MQDSAGHHRGSHCDRGGYARLGNRRLLCRAIRHGLRDRLRRGLAKLSEYIELPTSERKFR
jgi:hypothetical protein